jgi:hypothetical protein
MKKINTLLKNENVMSTLVIGGVFLLTGLVSMLCLYLD